MTLETVELVRKVMAENRWAYVLVNNRLEGKRRSRFRRSMIS